MRRGQQRKSDVDLASHEGFDLSRRIELTQIEDDLWVAREKRREDLPKHPALGGGTEPDRQASDLAATRSARDRHRMVGIVEDMTGLFEEGAARLRESDEMARAMEEIDPELALQVLDLMGKGGLGDMELFRRATEVQLVGDRDEIP
jgi:hypothetical protein